MENSTLVSIITPTFNHEDYIANCIDSVLEQDYPQWELIIIDDGSTDSTGEIVSSYKDNRIEYFRQENLGIFKLKDTYNKAVGYANGELIAILEGDDFWPPSKLSNQINAFEDPDVILSWGNVAITNQKGEVIEKPIIKDFRNEEIIPSELILKKLIIKNFIHAPTVMIRKNALIAIGGFVQHESAPFVDYSTWLKLSLMGKFQYFDELLGYWRRHGKQTTITKKEEMIKATSSYSIKFLNDLTEDKKENIGVDRTSIIKNCRNEIYGLNFHWGRLALYEKRWEDGKKLFQKSLDGSLLFKLKSIVGILFAEFHLNFEWIAKILKVPHIKDFGY